MSKIKVFMTDKSWTDLEIEKNILKEIDAEIVLGSPGTPEEICREGQDCDVAMVLFTPMGAENLRTFKQCKLLVRMGIGINTVDLFTATQQNIMVCNVPDYCQGEVADHVIALMLEVTRKIGALNSQVRGGGWDMTIADPVPRLQDKVFGLWGCGGIGQMTARRAAAFGMKVSGYDPYQTDSVFDQNGIKRYQDLNRFLSEIDVLSLHVPLTPETEHMINAETLGHMKSSAYLINTARGFLVNEEDLYTAIKSRSIAGAALDVLETEPPNGVAKLATLPNVVITPHAAWNSEEAIPELREKAAQEIVRFFKEGRPKNLVNTDILN
ncbi:C-terminal binding protein [bacterium]|nr:C-terminal binding protein [bacterium]